MFFKEARFELYENYALKDPPEFLKEATRVFCLSATFGGQSCERQLTDALGCKFIARCQLSENSYADSHRFISPEGRKSVTKKFIEEACKRALK